MARRGDSRPVAARRESLRDAHLLLSAYVQDDQTKKDRLHDA